MTPQVISLSSATSTAWIPVDYKQNPFNISLAVVLSNTPSLTCKVEYTLDDVFNTSITPTAFTVSGFSSITSNISGSLSIPVKAIRLTISSWTSGTATLTAIQGSVYFAGLETVNDRLTRHRAEHEFVANVPVFKTDRGILIDSGVSTGIVTAGAWSMIAGGVTDTTVTDSSDGDGFYVSYVCPVGAAGLTDRASAAMPAAYQNLSSGGQLDLVVDVVLPSDTSTTSCDLLLYLGNAVDMANSLTRSFQYVTGGTSGALKPGRNILTTNILGSSYQDTWTVNGSGTFSSPITHVALRMNNPTSGMEIKIRELRYRAIGIPSIILGFDDGHASVYWVYKLAAGLGLRGVLPIVGSYIGLASYMTLSQVQELKSLGFTPVNHTWAHTDLTSVTTEQARTAIRTNKDWLINNGFGFTPILVYPNGKYNNAVIQVAIEEGYLYARTAGKNQIRYLPTWGLENPYRLGSVDIGGKNLDTMKTWVDSISSGEQSALGWLYGHQSVVGNPAGSTSAPADTLTWYDGWYRQLIQYIALQCNYGKLRAINGDDFINLVSN